MKAFEYATALSPDTARELVGADGAYLAGGNDLLALMKEYLVDPKRLLRHFASPWKALFAALGTVCQSPR